MKLFRVFACCVVASLVVGCGGVEPPASGDVVPGAGALSVLPFPWFNDGLPAAFQTTSGHNTAVTSSIYTCNGWSYRLLFSLEQHQESASPTWWYAAVGPSSPAATGAITDSNGNVVDVSADVYLQCYGGILPEHVAGTFPSGGKYNEVYADYTGAPISCTLTTVWPASWHAKNPVLPVHLLQYDWNTSIQADAPGGTIYLDIDVDAGYQPAGGNGFCGRAWFGGGITEVDKFVPPKPPVYLCTGDLYTDYALHGGQCVVPPPDCTYVGHGPCPPPPDAT